MPFSSLGLAASLARVAGNSGYLAPTAIQAAAIPAILDGRDVLGAAQTGSGKTAAYVLPLLQAMLAPRAGAGTRSGQPRALILVPTRELAVQVGETVRGLAQHLPAPLKIAILFGGVSINPQMMGLRGGADIVVATPGRLLDLIDHNALALSSVATLVLDEADRLLDLGFSEEVARVLALLPERRQNLLFSATFPEDVQALADALLREPVRIEIAPVPENLPDIVQRAIAVDVPRRLLLLKHLIRQNRWRRVLVFVATKYAAEHVADKLRRNDIHAGALHGELSQGARAQVLADFKGSRLQVLVATDLAARGIDIVQLPAVVNFDLPRSAVDYTHRIGRTGRAGERGVAVSFISAASEAHFRLIEKRHNLVLVRERIAGFEPVEAAAPAPASVIDTEHGGVKGLRKSKKDKLREAAAREQDKRLGAK